MARKVFYSFDYENDSWRAAMVRNIGVIEGNQSAIDNSWESVKKSEESAIRRWIAEQLRGRSCTIVLIGAETGNSRWVHYEIEHSIEKGKGLLGIRIHRLLDQNQQESVAGPNPFDAITLPDGRPLSSEVTTYNPPGESCKEVYADIRNNLESWVEAAITSRPISR